MLFIKSDIISPFYQEAQHDHATTTLIGAILRHFERLEPFQERQTGLIN